MKTINSFIPSSPTAIATYAACPRRFYYRFIEKIPEPPSVEATKGKIKHSLFENAHPEILKYAVTYLKLGKDDDLVVKKHIEVKVNDILARFEEELAGYDEDKEKLSRELINTLFKLWLTNKKQILTLLKQGAEIEEILDKVHPFVNVEYSFFHEALGVKGRIDLIYLVGGKKAPVDIKTGPNTLKKIKDVPISWKIQVGLYALALEDEFNQSLDAGYVYLFDVNKFVVIPLNEGFRTLLNELRLKVNELMLTRKLPKAIFRKNFCSRCFYNHICNPLNKGESNAKK